MDPIALILTALAAGAALGVKDATSTAVMDAYESLKGLVKRHLAGQRGGELALARFEEAPGTWKEPMAAELAATEAGSDADLVLAARELMRLVDQPGYQAGKYNVVVQGGQGVQVGDHNIQHNTFGTPD